MPKRLRQRYRDFFIAAETARPITRLGVHHVIELKPGIEPPWMRTYNLSPAELKALEDYINEALAKGWIQESKSPTSTSILFIPRKNGELRLYVNY